MTAQHLLPKQLLLLALACWLGISACSHTAGQTAPLLEISGVTRLGDSLLLIDDSRRGVYFRYPLRGEAGPVIALDPNRLEQVRLPQSAMATDLESIDVLADRRIAVLSERLRALFGMEGVIAEYEAPFGEFGKRGLEGLAVRPLADDGSSFVAVLWEGGYPEYEQVPEQLRKQVGRQALQPIILTHALAPGETGVVVRGANYIPLDVPLPAGSGRTAQRFRAPDLVWYRHNNESWAFIVLLSSQNSTDGPVYAHHWLQRFSARGQRIGDPIDLDRTVPPDLKGVNWEGLAWFEEGKRLVIAHESHPRPNAVVYVLDLPEEWRFEPVRPPEFTHWVERETAYFLRGPQASEPPDGKLDAGTKVKMLENLQNYCRVRTDANMVVYIETARLKPFPEKR